MCEQLLEIRKETWDLDSRPNVDIELENIKSDSGTLTGDTSLRTTTRSKFCQNDVLFGRLRPYLHKWWLADTNGVKSGEIWALVAQNISSQFAYVLVQTTRFLEAAELTSGTKMPRAEWQNISELSLSIPTHVEEQERISELFHKLDSLIAAYEKKLTLLKRKQQYFLQAIFSQKLRFKGFAEPWRQRKLGKLVLIERGGSPRPIDDYITTDKNGLNWVKISDAPLSGRYITQTEEKIRPEGLKKTRQVKPGDLILSNSMSFGRPYIMAIDGCIHDGWLLIRDINGVFDLKYLCQILSSPQMLDQYHKFAAGSTVNNLNKNLVGNALVSVPSLAEQHKIGAYFDKLDNLITTYEQKFTLLKQKKQYFLQNLFV